MRRGTAGVALSIAVLALGTSLAMRSVADVRPAAPDQNWADFGQDSSQDHYSPLTQINQSNVSKLGLVWSYDIDTFDSYTSPLEVDGKLYFGVGLSVIRAMDAVTGKLLWTYDPKVAEAPESQWRMREGWGIRGIAYKDGKVFTGTRDGRLIAIDAKSGKLLWSVQTLDDPGAKDAYITGPPFIAGDNVMIGFGGADYSPVRGYVSAYNINTGKKAWRFFLVPGDPKKGFEDKAQEMAAKTWTGEWWKWGGGGTAWQAMAYDKRFDRVYIGTGNGFPWNQKIRSPGGGDNLFLGSIVALDAKTGKYAWHYQVNPGNSWDFNDNMDIELTDLMVDGKLRPVILHAPKNGFFYVIDRETGKLLSADKFAKVNWADHIDLKTGRPVENPDARYPNGKPFLMYPWPSGAHPPQTMAYSPQTKLAYIPTVDAGFYFVDPPNLASWKYKPGGFVNTGTGAAVSSAPPEPPVSILRAYDPVTQKPSWSVKENGTSNGGVIATAGGLVFQGQNTGQFTAFAAADGKKLWSFDAQDGILGNAITYSVHGKQYVTVITGFRWIFRNNPHWDYSQQKRRVLTFALGGTAKLPKAEFTENPVQDDPAFKIDPEKAKIGEQIFTASCSICHGVSAISGGTAPDLRKSGVPLDAATFEAVVHDGAIMERGMPKFGNLSGAELEGLRHYIRQRARDTKQCSDSASSHACGQSKSQTAG
jgi:quinohemoprotein ethanol dehydrogenase